MEKNQQELFFKLNIFEQQMQQLQEQLQAVERSILDLVSLNFGLEELVGSKGKEILAPIGRGIFAKTKLDSEELTIDIGGKTLVKKNIPDTKKLIEEQIKKLKEIKEELKNNLDQVREEMTNLMKEYKK